MQKMCSTFSMQMPSALHKYCTIVHHDFLFQGKTARFIYQLVNSVNFGFIR